MPRVIITARAEPADLAKWSAVMESPATAEAMGTTLTCAECGRIEWFLQEPAARD